MENDNKLVDVADLREFKSKFEDEIKTISCLYELDSDGDIMPVN